MKRFLPRLAAIALVTVLVLLIGYGYVQSRSACDRDVAAPVDAQSTRAEAVELKERLRTHLTQIVRQRDPYLSTAAHFYVQQYIRQQMQQWGAVEAHEFQVQGKTHTNLILNLPTTPGRRSQPVILIGAHYDTVPGSPGADDNGTGIAVLLELARSLVSQPANYPIRLVAFDMEEYGLLGSGQYAAELRQQQQSLRLMLSLEMLGYRDLSPGSQHYPAGLERFYPNCGNFIGLIGNLATLPDLLRLSHRIRRAGVPCEWLPAGKRGKLLPVTRRSDHASFWDQGYRAMMVTDTANLRNPHYHQASDRLETLDLDFLTAVCQGLTEAIRHLS